MRRFFSFLAILMLMSFPVKKALAQEVSFAEAESLFYAKKTADALISLSKLCENGEAEACSLLGFGYYSGRFGLKKSIEKSVFWFKKCASKEKGKACQKELGRIYYLQAEYEKAFQLYAKLARKADPEARYWLGRLYREGKGQRANYSKSLYWLRLAAHARKNPSKQAQCELLEMSYFGIGLKRTMKDVNYWLRLCDNFQVQALKHFFGHSVPKNRKKAKQILEQMKLTELLGDWQNLSGERTLSVGKKSFRDKGLTKGCLAVPEELKNQKKDISSYVIKIFNKDFYRDFEAYDGYVKNIGIGDQTFEACGTTFYTNPEEKLLFLRSMRKGDLIKIFRYSNACLSPEIVGVCDLNLHWQEEKNKEDAQ